MRYVAAAVVVALSTMALSVAVSAPPAQALDNGLALTPQMGFNNWNTTGCGSAFNEQMVMSTADTFVSKGLKDAGYNYVNMDDCWAKTSRNAQGDLEADPARFPHGIKYVADYVHSKGLKFGIYTSAGTKTCNDLGFPGGLNNEQRDANLFASWGVDYLKYDNCNNQGVDAVQRYTKMRDALKATGRPILFSVCEWGENSPWNWAQNVGNSWRTTGDISDNWGSMLGIFQKNVTLAPFAKPGAWNDPDMLEVGNGGMTPTEYRSHFSLWAIMNAPLLIGANLANISPENFQTLLNSDVIALDQDARGAQGREVKASGGNDVIAKPLANGDVAVALFNENATASTISTTTSEIGIGGASSFGLKDLWSKAASTTSGAISASVPAHGTVVFRVSKAGTLATPPSGTSQVSDLAMETTSNSWGPAEKDRSNGEQAAGDGKTLTINGVTYAKGLGVHARSDISFYMNKKCTTFSANVGVDDEIATDRGTVGFEVYADSAKVADSGTLTGSSAAKALSANVTGATRLRLVVTNTGDGIDYDHGDWATPTLTCP
jgi:alpha-galactosidase